jgi:hypothetical protein
MALEVDPKKALVEFVVAGLRGAADAVQPKSANLANLKKINKSIEGLNFAEKIEALSLLLYGFGKLLVEFVVDFLRETASMVKKPAKATKSKSDKADTSTSEKLEALALLLYSKGKGFSADAIDGEWDLVFTKQGKKSPTFQKMVGSQETAGSSKNIFDVGKMVFHGGISFWKFGKVSTSVKVRQLIGCDRKTTENNTARNRSSQSCLVLTQCFFFSSSLTLWFSTRRRPSPFPGARTARLSSGGSSAASSTPFSSGGSSRGFPFPCPKRRATWTSCTSTRTFGSPRATAGDSLSTFGPTF